MWSEKKIYTNFYGDTKHWKQFVQKEEWKIWFQEISKLFRK